MDPGAASLITTFKPLLIGLMVIAILWLGGKLLQGPKGIAEAIMGFVGVILAAFFIFYPDRAMGIATNAASRIGGDPIQVTGVAPAQPAVKASVAPKPEEKPAAE